MQSPEEAISTANSRLHQMLLRNLLGISLAQSSMLTTDIPFYAEDLTCAGRWTSPVSLCFDSALNWKDVGSSPCEGYRGSIR